MMLPTACQTAQQAQRERNTRFGSKYRVTGDEEQAQEVVADIIIKGGFEIRHGHLLLCLDLASDFFVLALEPFISPQEIDCTVLCGGHQPGARVVRNA